MCMRTRRTILSTKCMLELRGYGRYFELRTVTQFSKAASKNYIKHERPYLTAFPNIEMRFENTTRSRVLFEVFGNVVKHCFECLVYLLFRI